MTAVTGVVDAQVRAACARGDHAGAAELIVRAHTTEIVAYLGSLTRGVPERLDEAFSMWCENVLRGVAGFQFASSVRTWAYTIARNAAARCARDHQRRTQRLTFGSLPDAVVAAARTETADYLRTAMKERLANVRASLADDERELLHLRVDRQLTWREIEEIVREEGAPDDAAARTRREAALRKRFESLKRRIKTHLAT